MSKKDRNGSQSPQDDTVVRLKPILGLRPGLYLIGFYAVVVIVILFFILLYPGLHARGSFLAVTTYPDKATVKVDGQYAGSTPCTVFMRHGERTVEIRSPFYAPVTLKESVRGRVFATLLFPDTKSTKQGLSVTDLDGLLSWSLGDFQKNPEIPQILSDTSRAATDDSSRLKMYDFLDNAARYVTSESQLRELLLAAVRASSGGTFLTPSSFVSFVEDSIQVKQKYDNSPFWLLLILARDKANKLAAEDWVQSYLTSYRERMSKYYTARFPPSEGAGGRLLVLRGREPPLRSRRGAHYGSCTTTWTRLERRWTSSSPTPWPLTRSTSEKRKSRTDSLPLSSLRSRSGAPRMSPNLPPAALRMIRTCPTG